MSRVVSPNVAWQLINGEAVVVDLASGRSIGLNSTGSLVWSHIEEDDQSIARLASEQFGISYEQAVTDVREFVQELERRKLVSVTKDFLQ